MSRQNYYKQSTARKKQAVNEYLILTLVRQERSMQPMLGCRKLLWLIGPDLESAGISIGRQRIAEVFIAADLLREANRAMLRNNFEREFRYLKELVDLAGDVPAVAVHIIQVAWRYRRRNMPDRSEVLLSALVEHPDPPVGALVALADVQRGRGDQAGAIALLQRAVGRVPDQTAIRRRLDLGSYVDTVPKSPLPRTPASRSFTSP